MAAKSQPARLQGEKSVLLEHITAHGHQLYYLRDCLLPCLILQVSVRERGREEMGPLELTVLRLVDHGVGDLITLARLTGLAERTVARILAEKEGESLVFRDGPYATLTSLGEQVADEGVPMRRVRRALRYCALNQQLLPAEAYHRDIHTGPALRENNLKFRDIIAEPEQVSLSGLAAERISNPVAVGLSDETAAIEEVEDYEPGFQEARLAISGRRRPEQAWLVWEHAIQPYALEQVHPLVQAFDPEQSTWRNGPTCREAIETAFHDSGAVVPDGLQLDGNGMPFVVVTEADEHWLGQRLGPEQPWILLAGTRQLQPIPISRYPMRDALQGHTLRVSVENEALEADIETLRSLANAIDAYHRIPPGEREYGSVRQMLEKNWTPEELERAGQLVRKLDVRKLRRWFESE